jgi:hypothetical protein
MCRCAMKSCLSLRHKGCKTGSDKRKKTANEAEPLLHIFLPSENNETAVGIRPTAVNKL